MKRGDGNWVDGDRFWDREHEQRALRELLEEGSHVLIVAPRRVGKTSLMRQTARNLGEGWVSLHVDLQGCRTAAEAIVEIGVATRPEQSTWARTREVFKNWLGNVEEIGLEVLTLKLRDSVGPDWQAKGSRLFQELATVDRPVVLFLDELPILVNRMLGGDARPTPEGIAAADAFVSWLRAMSIQHKGKIRLVIAGSIGLEPVLHRAGLSATINTLTPLTLDPWPPEVAKGCLAALAATYKLHLETAAMDRTVTRLGACIPHHVQMFFAHLQDDSKRRNNPVISEADVERVYKARMLTSRGHAELLHLEERLNLVLGPTLLPLALDLLTETAVTGALGADAARILCRDLLPEAEPRRTLRPVLEILEHDGYLRREGDRYVFLSNLLKDWWHGRFSFDYVPAADRDLDS